MTATPPTAHRLKELIIESLNLEGMTPEMIGDCEPLFGAGLGLDSVDALELVVALEKEYGIKIRSDEVGAETFATAASLSRFVEGRRAAGEGSSA
jgi:acyl carrier protein